MATEKELRDLNDKVYQVDPDYKDKKIKYTDKPNNELTKNERNELTAGNQEFKVLSVKNGDYGFQGMAVAPIVNGTPDYGQVTVVAAGTYPDDWDDKFAAVQGMFPNGSPQADVALQYVGELIDNNPNWTINQLSGYSQSAYMLKVGAHFKIPTTVFSGWFQYRSLTPAEEKFMKENPHLFLNYRQKNDDVTKWNDFNSKWGNSDDFGTIVWIDGNSHKLTSWEFDEKTGQLKISDSSGNSEGAMIQASHFLMRGFLTQLTMLDQLKAKLTASGGGLSKNEKIYLDDQQALLAVNTGRAAYQNAMANAIKVYQNAITEAEGIWQETLREARSQIEVLSDNEMKDSLSAIGATEQRIVGEPTEFFQQRINKAKTMDEKFESLAKEIKSKIDKIVQTDQQLAQQLKP
ncbi:hypothetical protein ACWOC1_09380 [Enterococcus quebecensis]|uniref:Lipase n=1 Tax=Enterococcus quebecensis TaxID=903983 RepID=A0A1E5GSK7_9ENTE|nr:hypothetical protein [Enterococcus quebecensis]OEG15666.1 hypothetical protein BCR23_09385 [Enterococcus quebecensis]OJG70748.1 hypothetical protein RV12_GL001681 [Enterococcus quebecensis]